MSSVSRSMVTLPEDVRAALNIRTRGGLVCPAEIEKQMEKISFFRTRSSVPNTASAGGAGGPVGSSAGGNRFGNIGRVSAPEGWRNNSFHNSHTNNNNHHHHGHKQEEEEGFVEVWSNRRKQYRPSSYTPGSTSSHTSSHTPTEKASHSTTTESTVKPVATTAAPAAPAQGGDAWKSSRYKALDTKLETESMEDRIMGKVRSKVNKIGESTYAPTKAFMQQILDSGETDFLNEFMRFVFQKAATEPSFCGIYAKLLHELADEFAHLRTEMQSRFREYLEIFGEADKTPDVGTADYARFVESQERKKFRRGYSQFVAELVKYGEVNMEDFRSLIEKVVKSIQEVSIVPDNTLLCEEYVDCLMRMCKASSQIVSKAKWMKECLDTLKSVSASARSDSPGLTNKARFAIMDLLDLAAKGWK